MWNYRLWPRPFGSETRVTSVWLRCSEYAARCGEGNVELVEMEWGGPFLRNDPPPVCWAIFRLLEVFRQSGANADGPEAVQCNFEGGRKNLIAAEIAVDVCHF